MDLVTAVGADEQATPVVEPGEGAFDDPAVVAESGAVLGLSAGDDRLDAAVPDEATVFVVVVAAVGEERVRPSARPAGSTANGRYPVEQVEQLRDVVAIGGG